MFYHCHHIVFCSHCLVVCLLTSVTHLVKVVDSINFKLSPILKKNNNRCHLCCGKTSEHRSEGIHAYTMFIRVTSNFVRAVHIPPELQQTKPFEKCLYRKSTYIHTQLNQWIAHQYSTISCIQSDFLSLAAFLIYSAQEERS